MRKFVCALVVAAVAFTAAVSAHASSYTFVGSYSPDDGPGWTTNPLAYTALDAAALVFGGSPSDYAISTVDSNPADINFMANYNEVDVGPEVFAENYFRGVDGVTHYEDVFLGDPSLDTVSAYVDDFETFQTNYVFRIDTGSPTPEPGSLALLSTALLGACGVLRHRMMRAV